MRIDKSSESFNWKEHHIKQGDGKGGWKIKACEYKFLHHKDKVWFPPFCLEKMDNGEIVFLGTWEPGDGRQKIVITFTKYNGDTWSEPEFIPDADGRPHMLIYLGKGSLTFVSDKSVRYFSRDYGRRWKERMPVQFPANGRGCGFEGNPLVERDKKGVVTRVAETGYTHPPGKWPKAPCEAFIRWSYDGCRTWLDEVTPKEWQWQERYKGKTYRRGISEGSLVRAKNGWLVAAIRTDMPPRYFSGNCDDSLCGTGVSISKDDGRTWSKIKVLYDAGRHHANLLRMPKGDIVMTMTVRTDVRDGKLASYRRGCDAVISRDNGLTWDLAHKFILDEYEFFDPMTWCNGECGHLYSLLLDSSFILTAHTNYLTKGTSLIRWRP